MQFYFSGTKAFSFDMDGSFYAASESSVEDSFAMEVSGFGAILSDGYFLDDDTSI